VIGSFQKHVGIVFYNTTLVLCAIDVPYGDVRVWEIGQRWIRDVGIWNTLVLMDLASTWVLCPSMFLV
jgi:hypothetical protein